jgi:hypothetical protein
MPIGPVGIFLAILPAVKNARHIVSLALVAAVAFISQARADRQDFLVNDDGSICDQLQPRVAAAGDKGFVVVWTDTRNGQNDIYLQRYTSAGIQVGGNMLVNSDSGASYQAGAAIASDYSGRFAVCWQDYRNGNYPFTPDIFLQAFDSSLSLEGGNRDLTALRPDSLKEYPDVALAPWGGGVVVWSDYRNRNWDIYGQRFDASGIPIGGNFKMNDDVGSSQQHAPKVSISAAGWFVVTWYDNRSGNDDIFVQRFDSSAHAIGPNIRVSSDATNSRQAFPDIAADGSEHFTVVWVDWRNGVYPSNPDIYARRFDTSLTPLTADTKINADGTTRAQREPSIASDRRGNVAIVWSDSTSTSWDIVGQMLDTDGRVRVANFRANFQTDSAQQQPDVALDGRYRYISWTDRRSGQYDIYASIVQYNAPALVVAPAALNFSMEPSGSLPAAQPIVTNHSGYNAIHFEALTDQPWLAVSPLTGVTPDTISVRITDTSLAIGSYSATIRIIDLDNADSSQIVAVTVKVSPGEPKDTLQFGSVETAPGASTPVPIRLAQIHAARRIDIPISYDPTVLTLDSVVLAADLPISAVATWQTGSGPGKLWLRLDAAVDSLPAPAGYQAATLYVTPTKPGVTTIIDTAVVDSIVTLVVDSSGAFLVPHVIPGTVTVSSATPVTDGDRPSIPQDFALEQNYPNPFNGGTRINFALPHAEGVKLEIFNILGQKVCTLLSGVRPAGYYSVSWDGDTQSGQAAPSGIYFYRLQASDVSLVQKMILAK